MRGRTGAVPGRRAEPRSTPRRIGVGMMGGESDGIVAKGGAASCPDERDIRASLTTFPGGTRDFTLARRVPGGAFEPLRPADLLALDRAAEMIEGVGRKRPDLALVLALCRLLLPCLAYRGSDRHLVAEPWSEADLRGETIPAGVPTTFARELSAQQAEDWHAVAAGARRPITRSRRCSGRPTPPCPGCRRPLRTRNWGDWPRRSTSIWCPKGTGWPKWIGAGSVPPWPPAGPPASPPWGSASPPGRHGRFFASCWP